MTLAGFICLNLSNNGAENIDIVGLCGYKSIKFVYNNYFPSLKLILFIF